MKFILFVEGDTERKALPEFLKRWLETQLDARVGIQTVGFAGAPELWRETPKRALVYLNQPGRKDEIIAVIALLDLHGPEFYPDERELRRWAKEQAITAGEPQKNCAGPVGEIVAPLRYEWAKRKQEQTVDHPKFRQFFAVHETEAWLLSDRRIFPNEVRKRLPNRNPEEVNLNEPPAACLERVYHSALGHHYKKVVHGRQLFQKLDPSTAYDKCPCLHALLNEMLALAQRAGL